MCDDIGSFRVDIDLEHPARPGVRCGVSALLVDTGSELTWVPAEVLESLGSRTLEGLNVIVDPVNKRLVDAGAMPAAAA